MINPDLDLLADFVMDGKRVCRITVELLCPQMRVGPSVYQPGIDPDVVGEALNAPLQHIADAQFAPDLPRAERLVRIGSCSSARGYDHTGEPGTGRSSGRQSSGLRNFADWGGR
jgi:hypothetical protein